MTEVTQQEVEAAIRAAGELGDDASTLEWVATILHAAAVARPAQAPTDVDASLPTAEDVRGILGPPRAAQTDAWVDLVSTVDEYMQQVARALDKDLPGLLMGSYKEIGRAVASKWPTLRSVLIKTGGAT